MYLFIMLALLIILFISSDKRYKNGEIKNKRYVVVQFEDAVGLFKSPICFDRIEKRLYYYHVDINVFIQCNVEVYKHRAMFAMMIKNLKRRNISTVKKSFDTLVKAGDSINTNS